MLYIVTLGKFSHPCASDMKQIIYYWPKSGSDPTAGKTAWLGRGLVWRRRFKEPRPKALRWWGIRPQSEVKKNSKNGRSFQYQEHYARKGLPIWVFLLGATAKVLRANINWKSAISLQWGQLDPKFQVDGVASTNHSSQKTRLNDLSYGIKIWTDLSSVFHNPHVWQTDRQLSCRL